LGAAGRARVVLREPLAQGVAAAGVRDADRPVGAAMWGLPLAPCLKALEVGQEALVGPLAHAQPHPALVVAAVAAVVGHEIDRGGSSQHLAALELDAPASEIRLRLA